MGCRGLGAIPDGRFNEEVTLLLGLLKTIGCLGVPHARGTPWACDCLPKYAALHPNQCPPFGALKEGSYK